MTAAFVVTWKGRLIGEKYGDGIDMHTLTRKLVDGKEPHGDPHGYHDPERRLSARSAGADSGMAGGGGPEGSNQDSGSSSGCRAGCDAPRPASPDSIHPSVTSITSTSIPAAPTRSNGPRPGPQEWPPNTVGRYRNCDPVLINYLVRLGVEGRGEEYLSFPRRELFDKIGIRNFVVEADPYGNFLLQGYELGSGRDWARLGNLYLQDGVWNGERILPEGYAKFVSTVAPAWAADGRPVYGGFFWINGTDAFPIPRDAYSMQGAGGQYTIIIPSHSLVVVRLGHYKGSEPGEAVVKVSYRAEALSKALALLMEAVPRG